MEWKSYSMLKSLLTHFHRLGCLLICLVQLASPSPSPSSSKLVCEEKLRCPPHVSRFSIHIDENAQSSPLAFVRSPVFAAILATIRNSSYYTADSSAACLHIAPVDTIDRDRRSKSGHFIFFVEQRLRLFAEWTDPTKIHLLFNHYTGTWPSYHRSLDFRLPSRSLLASPSFTSLSYNCASHLTFPLFHADYPSLLVDRQGQRRSLLLSFKGKSYADVQHHRTFFRHLDNQRDIRIEFTDQPDLVSTDREEYLRLLSESHFCLVPTGRRLSSYRFLECLQHACVPVLTTENGESLLLPFSELIDWSRAVIDYSNRSLSLLPRHLRQITAERREEMQEECAQIWSKYFSSIPRIVLTSLDVLRDRFILSSSFLRS